MATFDPDAALPPKGYAQLGDFRIMYRDTGPRGDKKPLLLVHGLGSSSLGWSRLARLLPSDRRVIAIDLPGNGGSDKPRSALSIELFASLGEQLLQHLGVPCAVWVGHSMGGQVSLFHAFRRPNCGGLVLLAPAGFERFTETQARWMASAVTEEFVSNQGPAQIRTNMQLAFYRMPPEAEGLIHARVNLRGDDLAGYSHAFVECVKAMIRQPVYSQLPLIACPVKVIYGEQDVLIPNRILHPHLTPRDVGEAGARLIPNAELTMLPDAGHMLHFERPEIVAQLIASFLAEID